MNSTVDPIYQHIHNIGGHHSWSPIVLTGAYFYFHFINQNITVEYRLSSLDQIVTDVRLHECEFSDYESEVQKIEGKRRKWSPLESFFFFLWIGKIIIIIENSHTQVNETKFEPRSRFQSNNFDIFTSRVNICELDLRVLDY